MRKPRPGDLGLRIPKPVSGLHTMWFPGKKVEKVPAHMETISSFHHFEENFMEKPIKTHRSTHPSEWLN